MTLSVARHFQVQDKVSTDIVRKDIGGCKTCSSIRLKDIVRCEIFAVVRHLQLLDTCSCQTTSVPRQLQFPDICSCQTLSVKNLKDIVCCEIFAVARHLQLPDKFSCQAFTVARHLLLLLAKLDTSLVLMNNLANIVSLGFFSESADVF